MTAAITLMPGRATLADWRAVADGAAVRIDLAARPAVDAGARAVAAIVAKGEPVYGINTGFGKLAQTRIPTERLAELQRNLVLSHAPASARRSRPASCVSMLATQGREPGARPFGRAAPKSSTRCSRCCNAGRAAAHSVPRARSARRATSRRSRIMPAVLIGEGEVDHRRTAMPARRRGARRAPASRHSCSVPRKGLALLNGTQVSTALALAGLFAIGGCVRRRRWSPARCRWKRSRARSRPSTRASTRCAASRARSRSPPRLRALLDGQRDPRRRTPTATSACRIRIGSAASRR